MSGFGAVSVTVGVICLVIAGCIAVFGDMEWPRVVVALVVTGTTGILNGSVGPYIHRWVTEADQYAGQWINQLTGAALTGLLALVVFAFTAFRVWRNRIDTRTLVAAGLVPATVTMIPGTLGTIAVTVVGVVPWLVAAVLSWSFGIG